MSDPITMLADKIEPELIAAFLDAIEDIRANIDVPSLIEAAKRGDDEEVLGYVADRLRLFQAILESTFARSSTIAAARLSLTFDPADATAISARATAISGLMRSIITDTARTMLQAAYRTTLVSNVVAGTMLAGLAPAQGAEKAILVREAIGLSPAQGISLAVYRAALENVLARQEQPAQPVGFGRELPSVPELPAHVLRHLSVSQRRSVEKATTPTLDRNRVEALVAHQRKTLLAIRTNAIATSGALTATNAGEHASWRQAVDRRDLGPEWRRFWQDVGDEKVRHAHREVKALNADGVGIDETFDTPLGPCLHPPLEINCRCRVELRRND